MNKQRGSILLYAMLMMIAILAISVTLIGAFTPKLRSITEATTSTHAIYAADTATEVCLYEARQQPLNPIARPILTNEATFEIASLSATAITITNDCRPLGTEYFRFRAVGTVNNVSRALEINQ
jgi:hypothetical protein